MAARKQSHPAAATITGPDGSEQPGFTVRALASETNLTVGNWRRRETRKGDVFVAPVDVAKHLRDHGIVALVGADSVSDEWFDQTRETDAELAARARAVIIGDLDDDGNPVSVAPSEKDEDDDG